MKRRTGLKVKFYIISLILLFLLATFIDIKIFEFGCNFIGVFNFIYYNLFSIICLIFVGFGVFFLLHQNHEFKGVANPCCKITKIEDMNYEFLTFITTYIIPLICFDFVSVRYKVVFFILLFIIGIIFVKMNLYLANPILALMGYRLYKIDTLDKKSISVISRDKLCENYSIDWIELDDTCWYVKRRNNERTGN